MKIKEPSFTLLLARAVFLQTINLTRHLNDLVLKHLMLSQASLLLIIRVTGLCARPKQSGLVSALPKFTQSRMLSN